MNSRQNEEDANSKNMDDKILIATIAVIGSVVVALVSLIASIINSRSARKASHSLELLKDRISSNNKAAEIADEEFHKAIEGLKKAIEVIQVIKDEIYMILHAPEESVLANEIVQKFSALSEKVERSCKSNHWKNKTHKYTSV